MKKFNMAIYFAGKVVYTLEVEADSIESAREITWDNFIDVAYADEHYHPCGDCAEYPDCKCNPKACEYSDDYEEDEEDIKEEFLPSFPYLRALLKEEVKDYFSYLSTDYPEYEGISFNDKDIEACVDNIIEDKYNNVLNTDFIEDVVHDYLEEKKDNRITYLLNKEKVCPLDKEERYELNELLNEKGGF